MPYTGAMSSGLLLNLITCLISHLILFLFSLVMLSEEWFFINVNNFRILHWPLHIQSIKYFLLWRRIHNQILTKRGVFLAFRKAQAAMEFLMTYGWALLVVLIVIGVLMYSGFANISNLLPEKCTFSISVNCLDHSVKKDSIQLRLENAAGRAMVVRSITATSEVLAGPSDSAPGTCELSNVNKNSGLKKGSKRVFDLNVRSSATLSATGGSVNDLDFLAGNVMLVRAQDACGDWKNALTEAEVPKIAAEAKYDAVKDYGDRVSDAAVSATEPSFTAWPTLETVRGNATARAEEYVNNQLLYHYAGIVARDATHPDNTALASQNARYSADRIISGVALNDFNSAFGVLLSDRVETLRAVSGPNHGEYPDDGFSFYYAGKAHNFDGGSDSRAFLQNAREKASSIISNVEAATAAVVDAARAESTRRYNAELVKEAARKAVEDSKGTTRSETAATFVFGKITGDTPEAIFNSVKTVSEQFKGSLKTVLLSGCVARGILGEGFRRLHKLEGESDNPLEEFRTYVRYISPTNNKYLGLYSFCIDNTRDVPSDYRDSIETYVNIVKSADIPGDTISEVDSSFQTLVNQVFYAGYEGADNVFKAVEAVYTEGPPTPASVARKAREGFASDRTGNFDGERAADVVSKAAEAAAKEAGATPASVAAAAVAKKQFVDPRVRIAAMSVHDKARDYLDNPYDDESVRAAIDRTVSKSENQPRYRAVRFVADLLIAELNNGVEPADVVAGVDAKTEELSSDISDAVNSVARAAAEGSRTPSEIQPSVSDIYDAASDVVSGLDRNSPGYHAATLVLGNVTGSNAEEAARSASNAARALRDQALASQSAARERFRDLRICVLQCNEGIIDDYNYCPVSLLDCSVLGVSCSGNVDCCSGVCEAGSCADVNILCGSLGLTCCSSGAECRASGLECSEGLCVEVEGCGSDGQACCTSGTTCVSGFECVSGTCQVPCGAEGQQCCTSGSQCTGDLVCADSGAGLTCQQCGSGGQVCCSNRTCNENFECTGQGTGTCVGDCGSQGQECCTGDNECGTDLVCVASGEGRTCQSCGGKDMACCTTGDQCTESNLECADGTCVEAEACGSEGQACCSGDTCTSGLECESGTCQAAEECGSEGSPCCGGNSCSGDLVCDGSTCVDATVSVPAYTHSFDDPINSDSPIEFPVANDDIPFTSVNFTVSDTVTGLDLTLTSQSKLPSGILNGPGVVPSSNGYVNIMSNLDPDHFDNGNVSSMNVTFRVERSFVSDNGVSPDDVSLFRYDETAREWVELDTVRLSDLDDGTYHYYEAIGTGDLLGVFAVALSQYISCAHIENSKGKNRYSIELVYSWYDSLSINHRIKGELLASAPE